MKSRIRYCIYKFFQFIFRYTPNFILKYILILIAKIIFKFNKKHRHIADVNLTLAYDGTLSQETKDDLIYKSYKSFIFNIFEFMENQYISKEQLIAKAKIENEDVILNAIKEKRKIIFVTAHYGGYEIALPYIALQYGTVAVVNRKMNTPSINELYVNARKKNNIIMLEKKVAAKGMLVAFKKGHHVAVVIDQNIKDGVPIDFFGKKAMATNSTARLALKFDAVLIPVFSVTNGFRDYTIKIGDKLDVRDIEFKTDDKIQELTQMQANLVEKQIREKPELWFWQHKRWKAFHEELYKKEK